MSREDIVMPREAPPAAPRIRSVDLFAGGTAPKASARDRKPLPVEASPADAAEAGYDASTIEVLEGLEPVRRRPGMYIGGTDEKALHHLFAEVIDNSMDEAVAGHATFIEVELEEGGFLTVTDNGRGIPVDPHPKFPEKSALEVIMTTLHAGGKFDSKVYETSGGLHGVGVSVVNALSDVLEVEVARGQTLYRQIYSRGHAAGSAWRGRPGAEPARHAGPLPPRRRRSSAPRRSSSPRRVFKMARSKAYLFGGVEIRWRCAPCPRWRARRRARPRRPSASPAACATISPARSRARTLVADGDLLRQGRRSPAATARSNGRSPGWRTRTASRPPTATRSRRPRAARTRAGCASRCCAACASMPSASARPSAWAASRPTT